MRKLAHALIASTMFGMIPGQAAAELYLYSPPSLDIMNNQACLAEGDFVSCSTTFLNYLASISPTNTSEPAGYVVDANQGALKSMVVVGTGAGGQIPINTDFSTQIDQAYEVPNNGNFDSATAAEPINGPTDGDSTKAWDMTIQSLIDALTIGDTRYNMLIGYDFNETGGTGQATQIWSMVTLRDVDGSLAPLNFELTLNDGRTPGDLQIPASHVYDFTTTKTFDGITPTAINYYTDMTYIAGDICVLPDGTFMPLIGGATTCPDGYTHISNNLGTNGAEWISYIPELDENLEYYMSLGYDVLSAQVKIGCFVTEGPLATACNDGGYDDIFIMAADVRQDVPEPATLLLVGLPLLGLGMIRRRKS